MQLAKLVVFGTLETSFFSLSQSKWRHFIFKLLLKGKMCFLYMHNSFLPIKFSFRPSKMKTKQTQISDACNSEIMSLNFLTRLKEIV